MKELSEEAKRLEAEVARRKQSEQNPKVLQRISSLLPEGVTSVADAIAPIAEGMKKRAEEMTAFIARMKEEIAQRTPLTCEDHPSVELPVDEERTWFQSWKANKLTIVYGQCPACTKAFSEALVNEKWIRIGIPAKLVHATLANFEPLTPSHAVAQQKVDRQLKRDSGFLILRGTFGTGKSHLAAAIIRQKEWRAYSGKQFITMADLISELRQTYADNSGQQKMIEHYRNVPVFVLDELSTEVKGVDIPQLLYSILADRYDKSRLTVITSNEPLTTIMDILGPRLVDRVRANHTVVTMEWESHRKKE